MTIPSIIRIILGTPKLAGTTTELAALAARGPTPVPEAVEEVAAFWIKFGGTVQR